MDLARVLRHLITPPWMVGRAFSPGTMQAIEAAIKESEAGHQGEIRFAVEAALEISPLLKNQAAGERALEVFSQLRVWDTEHNNGVLIYLLLADRDVEIVADRGIHQHVGKEGWEKICHEIEALFRQGRFEEGAIRGIKAVSLHLAKHYPGQRQNINELPDTPVVL